MLKKYVISAIVTATVLVCGGMTGCGGDLPQGVMAEAPEKTHPPQPSQSRRLALRQATSCSTTGVWAVAADLPVRWSHNMGLNAGEGVLHYVARLEVFNDASTQAQLCQLDMPGYTTRSYVGGETYALKFHDDVFDEARNSAVVDMVQTDDKRFKATLGAVLGIALEDVLTSAWPSSRAAVFDLATQNAQTNQRGVVIHPLVGPSTSLPAVNRTRTRRASEFYTALRHRFETDLVFDGCDTLVSSAVDNEADNHLVIDSTTLGCSIDGHGDGNDQEAVCSDYELTLANLMAPKLVATRPGRVTFTRVDKNDSCQKIRETKE